MEFLKVGSCEVGECFVSLELSGFKNALSRALNHRARPHNDLKRDEPAGTHAFRGLSHTFPVKQASCPPDIWKRILMKPFWTQEPAARLLGVIGFLIC